MGQCQLFKGTDFHFNEFGLQPVGSGELPFFFQQKSDMIRFAFQKYDFSCEVEFGQEWERLKAVARVSRYLQWDAVWGCRIWTADVGMARQGHDLIFSISTLSSGMHCWGFSLAVKSRFTDAAPLAAADWKTGDFCRAGVSTAEPSKSKE